MTTQESVMTWTPFLHYWPLVYRIHHYNDVIMSTMASQITSLTLVYSTVYSDADQRKHHSSTSLAFVRGIHRSPVNSLHKWPVTRKMFPFEDVIMQWRHMMTLWHGHLFCITAPLCTESISYQWIFSTNSQWFWVSIVSLLLAWVNFWVNSPVSEWVIKFNGLSRTVDSEKQSSG